MQTHTTNICKKEKPVRDYHMRYIYIYIYMAFFTTPGEGSKHRYNTVKIYNNQY